MALAIWNFLKFVRAVLEVGRVIPSSVVVIAEPFHAVLELPPMYMGLQDSLYPVFVILIRTSAIAPPPTIAASDCFDPIKSKSTLLGWYQVGETQLSLEVRRSSP